MARRSAISAVATAVYAALNVSAVSTLCPGGVYRALRPNQSRPYVSIGPCSEEPDDNLGFGYGAIVEVPIHIISSGEDALGDERAATIADAILALLDEPVVLAVTGYTVRMQEWVRTTGSVVQFLDGTVGYETTVMFLVHVRVAT